MTECCIISSFLRAMQFLIYLLVVVIFLLFYKPQIMRVRPILPIFPSCWLHLQWPIQEECNCEYPSDKWKQKNVYNSLFSIIPLPTLTLLRLSEAAAILCTVWFYSGVCPETHFVAMGITLRWVNVQGRSTWVKVIPCRYNVFLL